LSSLLNKTWPQEILKLSSNEDSFIFIYNANRGKVNGLINSIHKSLSPNTYDCKLCKLTHGFAGPTKEWKTFLETLPGEKYFLHKEEVKHIGFLTVADLPLILKLKGQKIISVVDNEKLSSIHDILTLKSLL
jgi:hypothetical protein